MRHIFIVNPTAGKYDQSKDVQARIELAFSSCEIDEPYELYISKYPQDATHYVRKQAMSGEAIRFYACGGDGTLNEVLNGIGNASNCSLAIIPIGTGNDFIKNFQEYQESDFLNIEAQIKGKESKIDVLEINGMLSINLISSGLDSAIATNVSKFKRLPLISGNNAYNLSLIYCFFTSLYHRFAFNIDDEHYAEDNYIFAVAANGTCYGGGYHAAPLADIQDGFIDIVCVKKVNRFRVLNLVNTYKAGEHLDLKDIVIYKQAKQFQLFGDKPFLMNIDGEIKNIKNPTIKILPQYLSLSLPKK
ncbi:MAG: YegS/Rv2252/BmrU family lipid kinase [Erysipelotrichaceae bacterium]